MADSVFDISGRRALVTGSTRGLGRALAEALARAGCVVAIHGRDAGVAAGVAAEVAEAAGVPAGEVPHVAFDVTDGAAVEAAVDALGPLDILVNNAGIQHRAPLLDFEEEAWRRVLDVNLTSAFLVGRAVARGMVERRRGKIVNVCSLQSDLARPGIAPYAASKGALKMLTKGMCADWGPQGLQVNAIGPGYFRTELTRALADDPEFDAWVRRRTPAGRWGVPDDLAGALLFLVSPASDYVCGQLLYVDGGMSAVV